VEDANRKHVRLPDLRLGFAMYQRTAARIERDGVVIPTMIESRGGTYQLTDYTIERLTDANRSARLAVPAADVPRVVRSGLESKGTAPYARVHPYVDGRELAGVSGEGIVGDPLLDRGAHVLGVRVRGGKAARGSLLISVYELVRNS
jgi:hypothetical protein